MRHDDSSKRPRVDPAQNPRLAAALGRLSQGLREAPEEAFNGSTSPASPLPEGGLDDLYVPDLEEVELLSDDDMPETAQQALSVGQDSRGGEEEMTPFSGEVELFDVRPPVPEANPASFKRAPSFRPGMIAYGPPQELEPGAPMLGDEEIVPSDGELQFIDPQASGDVRAGYAGTDGMGAGDAGAGDAGADGGPVSDGRVAADEGLSEAAPESAPTSDGPGKPPEASPWATSGEVAIDTRALPSSYTPAQAPSAAVQARKIEPPKVSSKTGGPPSWLTIALTIALVASTATVLLLYFNVIGGPGSTPGADGAPIQVPTPTVATNTVAATATPAPVATAVPGGPMAAAAPSASAAPDAPETAAPVSPTTAPVASITTTATPTSPAPAGLGPAKAPATGKQGGAGQSFKKPTRIF